MLPIRRLDRHEAGLSRKALLAAIATTGVMLALVAVGTRAPFVDVWAGNARALFQPAERLVFASPVRSAQAPSGGQGVGVRNPTAVPPDVPPSEHSPDTSSAGSRPSADAPAQMDPRLRPSALPEPSALIPSGRSVTAALTREQRDSVLFELSKPSFHELVANLKPTQAQRDSAGRETARRFADAKDQGRPVAIPMVGGGISVGIGRGPSREQRRRDSIIHDDYQRRLERLAVRVRSKQDSMRRADSIAALRTQRGDTTDE